MDAQWTVLRATGRRGSEVVRQAREGTVRPAELSVSGKAPVGCPLQPQPVPQGTLPSLDSRVLGICYHGGPHCVTFLCLGVSPC